MPTVPVFFLWKAAAVIGHKDPSLQECYYVLANQQPIVECVGVNQQSCSGANLIFFMHIHDARKRTGIIFMHIHDPRKE